MPDDLQVPVSNAATQQYEPFISAGQPFGEVHWLRTTSGGAGQLYAGLWRHGCATFDYVFPGDETFHVLEGQLSIAIAGGPTVELGPGDIVSFTKGQASTWTIKSPMKKFFVISG
ncbi:MAG: cupin domain-containing protein [Planctomycetota bacterium]|nr:cupin domain-containing protein [Planctomycetota bacterium]